MRVSFLAVVAVALLVGLGSVVAVKSLGLLSTPTPPEPTKPTPVLQRLPRVLVTTRPLFEGDLLTSNELGTRAVMPQEMAHYRAHMDEYIPAVPQEASSRFLARTVPGNHPLLKSDLQPVRKAESLHDRLLPGSRPVNVTLTKNEAAGWLIGKGDWVDVHIISNVGRTDNTTKSPPARREGLIVRHAHVIAKRDSLVDLNLPIPKGETTFAYTLSMNPYRAALLEYARTLGTISLEPVSKEEQEKLNAMAKDVNGDPAKAALILVGDPNTKQGIDEQARVDQYTSAGTAIGPEDLARVLQLKPLEATVVPRPITVETYHSVRKGPTLNFPTAEMVATRKPAGEYTFSKPEDKAAKIAPPPREVSKQPITMRRIGTPAPPAPPAPPMKGPLR